MNKPATLLAVVLIAASAYSRSAAQGKDAPSFRVRADVDTPLNTDSGWAGDTGENVSIAADRPFRLRLEVELADARDMRLGLEYRQNGRDWKPVDAHDFPYPLRETEITFDDAKDGTVPEGWRILAGDAKGLAVATDADGSMLVARAGNGTLISLYPPPWPLPEFSLAAEFRVSADADGLVGLVFGFEDAANHWRLWIDAGQGRLRLARLVDGKETILAEHAAGVRPGVWLEAEVKLEAGELLVNFADDALDFAVPPPAGVPVSDLGFILPAGGQADFRGFVIEGLPSSPPVSIIASTAYDHGAETDDLLNGSTLPFRPGSGVSLSEHTVPLAGTGRHAEFEWPLVIRHFADGGVMSESGDTFEFRMTGEDGRPIGDAPAPVVTLEVPAGHLGGTFVETPGRIGPWQAADGSLYFIMEPAESDNLFMMVMSTDGGQSWQEVDGSRRPATGDLESVDARRVGDTIHILHQVSESTRYHAFHTADHPSTPDTWAVTDELATEVSAVTQMASLVVRPDGSLVAFHVGDTLGYAVRSPSGEWSEQALVDNPLAGTVLVGPQAVLGRDSVVHLAYTRTDGTIWYRRLAADGTLSPSQQLATGAGDSEDDWGAILPLVYLPESDTVVVIHRLADGQLWERRITGEDFPSAAARVSDRKVARHVVDSQQAGADAVADGGTVHVLFIDEADGSIYSTNDSGGWQPATLQVDGIDAAWVRGNVYRRADGAKVYGYVYDAGSNGGAGFNRYGELPLDP